EFQLPAGKVWLSPVVDCFDGKVVSWSLSTRPDAELVNTVNATMFDRYLPFSCPLNTFVTDAVRFSPFHHH
ncbi:hypothetical protein ACRG2M_005346, partial [Escherichia coli]|nr:hypothetical protein [Escherichia coli]EFO3788626.1 hypothetical protein [Escherichia coli]